MRVPKPFAPPLFIPTLFVPSLVLALALVACQAKPEPTPPDFTLRLEPDSATLAEGGSASVALTLSRSGFAGEIAFSLAGAGALGSFDPASTSGSSSTLSLTLEPGTPPGSYPLSVRAEGGGLSRTASLALTVQEPPSLDVTGKVMDLAGQALSGVNVQLTDASGPHPLVVTDAAGAFSISGVRSPYTVSAVPPPPASTSLLPMSWSGVMRSDPQLVLPSLTGLPAPVCSRADATLAGTLSPAVAAGHSATVTFVAPGISLAPLLSSESGALAPGDAAYSLSVPFDEILCETTLTGKLIYLEYDPGGALTRSAVYDASVTTGNASARNIVASSAATSALSGDVAFPSGVMNATVHAVLEFGGAYALLPTSAAATSAVPEYSVSVPILAGLGYRTLAVDAGPNRWAYSELLGPGGVAELALPNLNTPISPSGATSNATPTFRQTPVAGATLYLSLVGDAGFGTLWLGASSTPETTLPALPPAAQLSSGPYSWYALNALVLRGAPSPDDLLDGRLVGQLYGYLYALYNPDFVAAGTINTTPMAFTLP